MRGIQKNKKIKNPFRTQPWLHSKCLRRREQRTAGSVGTGAAGRRRASCTGPALLAPWATSGGEGGECRTEGRSAEHCAGATVLPHGAYSGRKHLLTAISLLRGRRRPRLPLEPTLQEAGPGTLGVCKALRAGRPWQGGGAGAGARLGLDR